MATYTVKQGDTLNSIAGQFGYENYKKAGLTAKSGNPDLIRPGETFSINQSATSPKDKYVADVAERETPPPSSDVPQKTGDPTKPETPPVLSSADTAFASYLETLKPSPELTSAEQYLNTLTTQGKLDYEKALGTGETLGFATGEAGRVSRQNAILQQGASSNVQALIALNANRSKIGEARYNYEKAKLDRAQSGQFELSAGQSRYDASGKVIASQPKERKTSITSFGGNRVMIDSDTGEVIKNLGPTGLEDESPSVVTALQDAQSAIAAGADATAVRQRFLDNNPKKATLYNNYMKGGGVNFTGN